MQRMTQKQQEVFDCLHELYGKTGKPVHATDIARAIRVEYNLVRAILERFRRVGLVSKITKCTRIHYADALYGTSSMQMRKFYYPADAEEGRRSS